MTTITLELVKQLAPHLAALKAAIPLGTITDETDYDQAIETLNQLIDLGADDEHVAELIELVGMRIADYEATHYPVDSARDVKRYLAAIEATRQRQPIRGKSRRCRD